MDSGQIIIKQHPTCVKFLGKNDCFGFPIAKSGLQGCYGKGILNQMSADPTLLFGLNNQISCWFTRTMNDDLSLNGVGNCDVLKE